jgi:hypothetical protein
MNPEYQNVRFRAVIPEDLMPRAFGVITACNPDGLTVSDAQNKNATQRLQAALLDDNRLHFPVTGGSPDFSHAEPGFGVVWDSPDEAVTWGRKFQQEAVFWIEDGLVQLLSCTDEQSVFVGRWQVLCGL